MQPYLYPLNAFLLPLRQQLRSTVHSGPQFAHREISRDLLFVLKVRYGRLINMKGLK